MSKIKIEKNVPLPKRKARGAAQRSYLFGQMKVGDSFTTGIKYKTAGESDIAIRTLSNAARNWKNINNKEWKFSTAKMPNGTIRIWRIK